VSVEKQEASAESRLQWLDEELRQTKAALNKVEHELEQALNQIWNLDSGLRKLEESSGGSGGVVAALPGVQEEIRQLRSQADTLQERQNSLAGRSEEIGRQQQADLERERQERAALLKQAEAAARSVGQFESRIQLLEESLRHVEESVSELRISHQTLRRDIEEVTNRSARHLETALRLEHQAAGLAGEIEALQKRDGEIEDRVNLFEERVHRSEERVDKFEQHLSLPLDIKEQLDRGRFERQQLAERLGKLESAAGELVERTAEFIQSLARLDQRTQGQAGSIMEIAQDLQQQRETVVDQINRLVRTMERQRRRQAEALAQEIKELGRSEFASDK
jgi:chromosome segregation ATPase